MIKVLALLAATSLNIGIVPMPAAWGKVVNVIAFGELHGLTLKDLRGMEPQVPKAILNQSNKPKASGGVRVLFDTFYVSDSVPGPHVLQSYGVIGKDDMPLMKFGGFTRNHLFKRGIRIKCSPFPNPHAKMHVDRRTSAKILKFDFRKEENGLCPVFPSNALKSTKLNYLEGNPRSLFLA